ncbi:MAG: hypothetical protein K9G47_09760 [Bacteroidales bacterium]|nr:hypothetical protein [Bacteroidales bacterium]
MEPVFFLSTGRAGTKWFTNIIRKDRSIKVLHNAYPSFAVQNKFAYDLFHQDNLHNMPLKYFDCIKEIYLTGRENYLRYSFKTGKRLIETNSSITFFAPVLAKIFPKSKFVHLIRPAEEFVLSGLNRGYYTNNPQDLRRIIPLNMRNNWDKFSQVEKIAWLWKETNDFINSFGEDLDNKYIKKFYFKDLQTKKVMDLLDFIDINAGTGFIKKWINKPLNTQKKSISGKLSNANRNTISKICGDVDIFS